MRSRSNDKKDLSSKIDEKERLASSLRIDRKNWIGTSEQIRKSAMDFDAIRSHWNDIFEFALTKKVVLDEFTDEWGGQIEDVRGFFNGKASDSAEEAENEIA
jgi:hypothetical protein